MKCNECNQEIERKPSQSRQEARRLHREKHSKIISKSKEEKGKKKRLW